MKKELTKEIDLATFREDFDKICEEVEKNEPMILTLKSGRKVFLMSEEDYDNVSRFVITDAHRTKDTE